MTMEDTATRANDFGPYMTKPDANGSGAVHARRNGPKGLLPSTWLDRTLRVEYTDAAGLGVESTGTLLDLYPFGPVLSLEGERTALSWDRLVSATLINDQGTS